MLNSGRGIEYRTVNDTYKKIKVGVKNLDDAVLELGALKKTIPTAPFHNKYVLMKAIVENDIRMLREFSRFFYKTNGIYAKLCQYVSFMYRYDWYLVPEIFDDSIKEEKVLKDFSKMLNFLDNSYIKKVCGEMALKVLINGCYFGYIVPSNDSIIIQELPIEYCRTRYSVKGMPAIEFNMSFFDTFRDINYRMRILNLFPDEFKKGYMLYKKGKLQPDYQGEPREMGYAAELRPGGWYLLEPGSAFKFNLNGSDIPAFINIIPYLLDLDAAQDLDRRKQMQQLLKIIIQKLPLDKNGDLIFDVDEAQELHNNAVQMVSRAIGVDILTTFADVQVADMSDRGTTTTIDDLQKVQRTVYNEAGVSQLQFNSDGNIALNNSIANDEASMYNLLTQFESFLNLLLEPFNKSPKRCYYQAQFLPTTIYNYKDLAKLYKEHAQMGYTKMLPPVALGQTQSSVLANAFFENDILDLVRVFVPPLTSNVMNAEALQQRSAVNRSGENGQSGGGKEPSGSKPEGAGRPEKQDNEKTEKTIMNKQSM